MIGDYSAGRGTVPRGFKMATVGTFAVYFKISNTRSAEEFLKYFRVSLLINVKSATCFAEVAASSRRGRKVTDEAVSNFETSAYLQPPILTPVAMTTRQLV
jgi:hypothetical protein